ncbi:hypothetical protein PAN31108_04479 [Pandoraea anhela]|uniref:Uncharacterized protein n=1 Tax=Pandoraea anhela TaxID=2508295 RepID=A0A5E4YGL7_9BURK|nr:hypothetical protein PAN31108_04479 [Pandoraea anhela]
MGASIVSELWLDALRHICCGICSARIKNSQYLLVVFAKAHINLHFFAVTRRISFSASAVAGWVVMLLTSVKVLAVERAAVGFVATAASDDLACGLGNLPGFGAA